MPTATALAHLPEAAYGEGMVQSAEARAADPAARERSSRLVVGAAACAVLYLASTVAAYLLAEIGGRTLAAAIAAMAVLCILCFGAVRLSSALAYPDGDASGAVTGRAPSRRVGTAVLAQLGFLVLLSPLLTLLGRALGFHGTTDVPLAHRQTAFVLLLAWIAIVVAPWMEEVSMRGFLLSGLWSRFGFWPAAIVSSLVWAGLHGVSGVLIPFTVEGIVLCWIRRRTGSVRTGIALHSAQNVVASLASGAGFLVLPALVAAIVSLVATREGARNAAGRLVGRWLERVTLAADTASGRVAAGASRPALWIVAGGAFTAGLMLEATDLELHLGGGSVLTAGRILIVTLALPPLGWLLLTARGGWRAPAVTCLAGAAGCLVIIVSRVGVLLDSVTLVPMVGLGYALLGFGLLGLATTAIDLRARIAAGAAGLLLAATLTPLPYVITSAQGEIDQSLVTSLAAAAAIVSVGLTLRRPTAASGPLVALELHP
jgi:membrane protease YdiL (CAAX protease family)